MFEITASKLLIVDGVEEDPRMRARADRLREAITAREVLHVDDAQLAAIARDELTGRGNHGMHAEFDAIVILNRFRFDDDAERKRRIDAHPELDNGKLGGYGGFDWRNSGTAEHLQRTGLICQPAYHIHTVVGCPFRCAFCGFGYSCNLMMNIEDYVERLGGWIDELAGDQKLFQWDNYSDPVCFEPEYGAAKLLIDFFAARPGEALELYVGKSDNVDYLLEYNHRGHTVCCWSLSGSTQSREFEWKAASTDDRIASMAKCQSAGYPVRVRLSPIIPVRNWRQENREMLERLFAAVSPDLMTIESIRFNTYSQMAETFDLSLLDERFLAAMKAYEGREITRGCEVPPDFRAEIYQFFFEELARLSPDTPVAFCREHREMWARFADTFARWDQTPETYLCNCGRLSLPATV